MEPVVHYIDDFDLERFVPVAAGFGQDRFAFVVTPNVDHLIRFHDDPAFRDHYRAAGFVLLDSRFASRLLRLVRGIRLPVCTGSDLTATLFGKVIQPDDRILLVGGNAAQAELITRRFNLRNLRHHEPPMGLIRDPAAVEHTLRFIEQNSPFRFCFIAVGSPQQEVLAHALHTRNQAHGLALCVGASLNFLSGAETRAPLWLQRIGLEWLYRLVRSPRRLARRYLLRGPRFFGLLLRWQFRLRPCTLRPRLDVPIV